ncbi:UDP-N-acetylglucosamine transferase subunit ALG14 homolog [Centruroides sculpturatus]|uniref:UDP-N-acetylglucosamine transferase subunit ALG14 homolog n=1 Tax=Centruroides sculpturatus TaxID=218467 RepID=UPI000C6CA0C8|nr:UDP-N-acetylglucosamine transferase subunit ALG14 homolog [Centruroides sculpturatus]
MAAFTCDIFIHAFFSLLALFVVRFVIVMMRIHNPNKKGPMNIRRANCKLMVVMGSGGHTYEMVQLIARLNEKYTPIVYIIAETDVNSEKKVHELETFKMIVKQGEGSYLIEKIPRSRELHQSWLSSVATTLYAIIYSIPLVLKHQPDLIICNGPGTCIPICAVAFLNSVVAIKKITIVYVESICRVKTLSLSGRILYYFADHFLVQWPQLFEKYPRSKYFGRLVS